MLKQNERLDDLQFDGLKIIQNKNLYCFSSDAVLLCNFVKAKKNDSILDLCSGSGIVGILAQAKTGAKKLVMIEKQPELCDMCKRTLVLNNLTQKAEVFNLDVKDAPKHFESESFDVVCSNPPYFLQEEKILSGKKEIDMARFEIELSFDELCKTTSKLLKFGGKFYFINDSARISELITTLVKYHLEPKVIQFVFPKKNLNSNVVLIEAIKGAKKGAKISFRNLEENPT